MPSITIGFAAVPVQIKLLQVLQDRKFTPVKLAGKELFDFPFAIMTGEGVFALPEAERKNLRAYLVRDGKEIELTVHLRRTHSQPEPDSTAAAPQAPANTARALFPESATTQAASTSLPRRESIQTIAHAN